MDRFTTITTEFREVLRSYHTASGLNISMRCWTDALSGLDGKTLIPHEFYLHTTTFCLGVKRTQNEQCKICDLRDAPRECKPEIPVFIRTCHAGADEVLIPLYRNQALIGLVYLGQFRRTAKGPQTLEWYTEDKQQEQLSLARTLRSYMLELIERIATEKRKAADDMTQRILNFVEKNLASGAGLPDLAKALGLSVSRTRHLVVEKTKRPYRQLLEEQRLYRAQELLGSTNGKITWVARQVGFTDGNYFSRYFRSKIGKTPGEYREASRQVLEV